MKKLFFLFFCFLTCSIFAGSYPGAGQFEISGELIYFKPQIDKPFYAMLLDTNPPAPPIGGERVANDLDFCPGFRVELVYGLCDCYDDISLRYTYLDADSTDSINGAFSSEHIPFLAVGEVRNKLDIEYQSADLLYSHRFYCNCQFDFALRGGLHFSYFDVDNRTTTSTTIGVFDFVESSCTYGIGPQVGLQGGYRFTCLPCLTLNASAHGALLANHYDTELTAAANVFQVGDIRDEEIWRVVPFADIRAGLNYQFCICSFACSLEVGYEFMTYWKSVSEIEVDLISAFRTETKYNDVSYQGPYVNLAVRF